MCLSDPVPAIRCSLGGKQVSYALFWACYCYMLPFVLYGYQYPPMIPEDLPKSSLLSTLDKAKIAYFNGRWPDTTLVVAQRLYHLSSIKLTCNSNSNYLFSLKVLLQMYNTRGSLINLVFTFIDVDFDF